MRRVFALILMATPAAGAADLAGPKLPYPYTCEDIRTNVALYGKALAWSWAVLHGYTKAEINEARKCLRRV